MYKIFISVFLAVILVPQITLAAWWNPVSWFGRSETLKVEHSLSESDTSSIDLESDNKTSTDISVPERATQIDNKDLQTQISSLVNENAKLKAQIDSQLSAIGLLNQCRLDLSSKNSDQIGSYQDTEFARSQTAKADRLNDLESALEPVIARLDHFSNDWRNNPSTVVTSDFSFVPDPVLILDKINLVKFLDKNFNPPWKLPDDLYLDKLNTSSFRTRETAFMYAKVKDYVSNYIRYNSY